MKVEVSEITPVRKKVAIEIPSEKVDEAINMTVDALLAEAEVEGFRKGHVPREVVVQRYGKKILDQVASTLIEESYPAAMQEQKLVPTSKPELDTTEVKEGEAFTYSAFVDVAPNISLKEYRGVKVEKKEITATDEEVKDSLRKLQEGAGQFVETTDAITENDMVTIDFECTIGGETIPGNSAKGYEFKVEGGARFPEFEDAVMGKKTGDSASFKKSFPEHYHDKAVSGKEVEFNLKIVSAKAKVDPELNDEFARDLGCENVADLKSQVKKQIYYGKERAEKDRQKSEAITKIIKENPFDIPESMVDKYYKQIASSVLEGVRRGVANPRDVNVSSDEFKTRYFDMAINQAKGDLILGAIAKKENVKVTEHELKQAVEGLAASRGESVENIQEMLDKEGVADVLREGIMKEKVFDIILG